MGIKRQKNGRIPQKIGMGCSVRQKKAKGREVKREKMSPLNKCLLRVALALDPKK